MIWQLTAPPYGQQVYFYIPRQEEHTVPVSMTNHFTDSGDLWLVNYDNPLPQDFTPPSLVTFQGIRLHIVAFTAYTEMLAAMSAEGGTHGLQLISAYRPYEYQQRLFDNKTRALVSQGHSAAAASELAANIVQRPGASEHQTGLALDVTVTGQLTQDFALTKAGQWLAANSHRFGFIIRYPQHKTEITNIIYEPWHLRYVGIPHASIIWENGITLEEYAQFIASGPYIQWCKQSEGQAYYLVMFSEFLHDEPLPGLIYISSTRYGGGAGYIMTFHRTTY
ncbi:MAG: M15 family metallopeptidase [Defluviitaleaceae bacterium]|nr:M15 family metallopeptidase [Defluviitaleaceae bacterium]